MSKRTFRELILDYGWACTQRDGHDVGDELDRLLAALKKSGIPLDSAAPVSVEKASR